MAWTRASSSSILCLRERLVYIWYILYIGLNFESVVIDCCCIVVVSCWSETEAANAMAKTSTSVYEQKGNN